MESKDFICGDNVVKNEIFHGFFFFFLSFLKICWRNFQITGGPVIMTPHSECRGPAFDP